MAQQDEPMAQQPFPAPGAPDPERIISQQDFGRELTLVRQRAGLTVRQVAKACGIPASTAGDYFAGRHLPPASQPELLPQILSACGITDPAQAGRWQEALNRIRRARGRRPARGPAPYRGLASFQPEDTAWFFGREELALHLARLAAGTGAPGLPLAVVGPSGSGKTSLLQAGLVPRLRAGSPARPAGRPVVLITPGEEPLATLAGAMAPLIPHDQGGPEDPALAAELLREAPDRYARLISRGAESPAIIVDQFEEAFAAPGGETGRQEFVTAVSALSAATLVVIGLRADFYGHALRHPQLARALQERQIVVSPMSASQLRRVIVEPARKAGLDIEDGLVEVLLTDMRPPGAPGPAWAGHEAGALPLLSHALLATWERSRGSRLTVADYQASGGIRDAIARTAEAAYATLDEQEAGAARLLFLRLVHVDDDAHETRARVLLSDLPGDAATATGVLERFVEHRLVTLDVATAEITHEALLDAWPRLRAWIDADRDGIRIRRFITAAAQAWAETGRETAALLRGGQLALARDWAATADHRALLNQLARDFIDAGVATERQQEAAQRRRTRRLWQLVGALTVLVVLTAGLTGYAFMQRQLATTATSQAESRSVAVEADEVRSDDPALAAQLSLAAYRIAPTPGALASLLESSGVPMAARMFDSDRDVQSVALAPGGKLLAVAAADGTVRLWNVSRPGRPQPIDTVTAQGQADALYATAFSPNGSVLAAAGADGTVGLWRVTDPNHPVSLGKALSGPTKTTYSLAFSASGGLLAAGGANDRVWLWDVTNPAHPVREGGPLPGGTGPVQAVAFSPDGKLLAAGGADHKVRLWNVSNPAKPVLAGKPLTGPAGAVDAVSFSPNGRLLAAGSYDDKAWLWNVRHPARPARLTPFTGANGNVMAVAFSPGGRMLAGGSSDGQALIWNVATHTMLGAFPHPQPVTSVAWDGPAMLISGDADGYVRDWRVPPPDLMTGSAVNSVAFSPDGETLAVGDTGLQLWNPATHTLTARASIPGGIHNFVNAVAISPGGNLIATGYGDGKIQLWRPGARLVPLGAPQTASTAPAALSNQVESVAFQAGGRILASGADDGRVRLWDVADPARPRLLSKVDDSRAATVFSVAFSPSGHTLAAASANDLVRLWNVSIPGHPVPIGKALPGATNSADSVAFSRSGQTLVIGSADRDIRLWDVANPAHPQRTGPTLTGPSGYVDSVAFSPDGRVLAAGNTDGSVWLWNLTDPAHPHLIATLTGPTGRVRSVAFSPSGRTIAAADSAGLVWLWNSSARDTAAEICAMAGQPLSHAEWQTYIPGRPYAPPCPARPVRKAG
jgi:WD40 repeat protein/transcriptional regulator with XRE-family HTH domain